MCLVAQQVAGAPARSTVEASSRHNGCRCWCLGQRSRSGICAITVWHSSSRGSLRKVELAGKVFFTPAAVDVLAAGDAVKHAVELHRDRCVLKAEHETRPGGGLETR